MREWALPTESLRILVVEAIMSAVYVFDVSVYPFVHIPFYLLTILYFGSILEIYGMYRFVRWICRRFPRLSRHLEGFRALPLLLAACGSLGIRRSG